MENRDITKLENSIDGIISNFNFQLKILTEKKNLFNELYKLLKKMVSYVLIFLLRALWKL